MLKKLQIMLDPETQKVINRLISKPTKSFFVNMAIKNFAETKEGKNFLVPQNEKNDDNKEEKIPKNKKDNHFLSQNKKVKIEQWS
ncbi:hypothetical protein L5F43_09820 [Aliarcobacter butzleri]|uniref:Uncharacterized protein n=1 Tax=Aliarcobacter butzleri TaxID=28197 RepID=A0AAW7Q0C0_9BACT|nr:MULTISPECIES: hypothetical protein [Arcobacteraceae]MCG3655427.1 hypothetical protein [Aliarcobacter butzleri]MCG3684351.1 hypothetical protein [Aliarcobacter butzleri]MCG3686489.1 hypothetical protein [Aliarcobacter butzleri]MCG3688489.1 hypothetical protein [Aliarcobacter butzleri]MCG3706774.1 hypothetical protein [Aliarcobacter butzleri]